LTTGKYGREEAAGFLNIGATGIHKNWVSFGQTTAENYNRSGRLLALINWHY
jgi:hypothetical protein